MEEEGSNSSSRDPRTQDFVRLDSLRLELSVNYLQFCHDVLLDNKWSIAYGAFTAFMFYFLLEDLVRSDVFGPQTSTNVINLTVAHIFFEVAMSERAGTYGTVRDLAVLTIWITAVLSLCIVMIASLKICAFASKRLFKRTYSDSATDTLIPEAFALLCLIF